MTSHSIIVSKPNNSVLVPHDKCRSLYPDVPVIEHAGINFAIIPHTPRELIALRALGVEIPPPVLSYYDWENGKPFETQRATVAMLTSNQRAFVLNDMGTGKTKSALWAWRYLNKCGCAKKLLIVAPLSTLKFVWRREVFATMPDVKAVVLHGTAEQRRKLLDSDADVFIINHDGLKIISKELEARSDIDTLVLDELAVYRNNSFRSKHMRKFAQRFNWAWGMTGRPMPQAPTDVWAQCKILTPHMVPAFFRHAQSALMLQVSMYKWVPRVNAVDTAMGWMQPAVRFTLDDVTELPEQIHRTVDVEMSASQAVVYKKMSNEFAAMVENKMVSAANAGVLMNKLLQVGAGYVYVHNPSYVALDSESRKDALLELIEEAPEKCIVFAPWRHLILGLSQVLTENKIDHAVVHGETRKREEIFNAFQNTEQYRVLLADPGTVHHGLTLTAASTIIWYSPITSLEKYEQANARIRRVGQKHKQQFLHLQSTPVEAKIYNLLRSKARLQDEFLTLIRTATEN